MAPETDHESDSESTAIPVGATPPAARIALLPDVLRNKIAAGEVIERPASVVKELLENALDAGARQISIDLEEGGARRICISDDGRGMGPEDLALAFQAHATSKLTQLEDLDHISSLGFRGEALASMGSVARCSINSRPAEASIGWRVEVHGGRHEPLREAGGPRGTQVEVGDLFFNTPARRRFLKRTSTELGRCLDVVQRLALAHPGVGMVVSHNGKRVFDVESSMDLRARVRRTFGGELAAALVPVSGQDGPLRLFGFIAPARFARRDTSRQMWFLNGRFLRDRVLVACLREAWRGSLEERRQPVAFLHLNMPPEAVDVNVHPAKSEVRFREQRRLFSFLLRTLREAILDTDLATPGERLLDIAQRRRSAAAEAGALLPDPGGLPRGAGQASSEVREVPGADVAELPQLSALGSLQESAAGHRGLVGSGDSAADSASDSAPGAASGSDDSEADTAAWRARDDFAGPFLQVDRTFLLRALPEGFEVIDQHALHERVTFEEMRRDLAAGALESQRLLVPELVEVGRADLELLKGHFEALGAVGLELEQFGEGTLAVQALPARLRQVDCEGLVRDIIELLAARGRTPVAEELLEEVLHRAACRASVMSGDELNEDEIRSLLRRAREAGHDQTCPHARPTRVRFTRADLDRAFHRR